jgi:ATP-binding cassette subfamily B protein
MLYRPIRQLADRFNTLQLGMVSAERVFKILDTEEHIANNGSYFPEKLKGEIEFTNVVFSYDDKVDVLKNVSFHLPAGNCLALVGATGAGKTSIINVLTRFYETKSGLVTIDGVDIKNYDLNELRRICAVVLQDVFLFNDSIYNNVTLGRDTITKAEVEQAAKAIGVHDFITNLPDGYDYQVKERGALLSSGQRQLLAFLRAYLYNPQVLILDEATSSIDTQSEILIQNAIETLTKGRTSIIIAHRLSTIQKANEILVLDKGEIVERGAHESLLQNKGYYHKLHNYQTL